MVKYNKIADKLVPYQIPSTTEYKYKMDMGEWFLPIHPSVKEQLTIFNDLSKYGVVDTDFNNFINLVKKYNGITNQLDTILITNGSDNALRLVLELYATPESKILLPVPSYVHFECMLDTKSVDSIDKPYIDYKLTNDQLNDFLLEKLANNYDLCYFVNPSMPIGHMLTHENISHMLKTYPDTMFIIDEAYVEFSNSQSCSTLTEVYSNIIVIRTFSKFFSLASLRLGYLITCETNIKHLRPYYNNKDITKLAILCGIQTLMNLDFYVKNKTEYFKLKEYIITRLNLLIKSNTKITDYIMNDGVYFTLISTNPAELKKYFNTNDVAVRNKDSDIKGAIRITINDFDSMKYVFDILENY
jgi:histidinol-phosphate aminotransferase